MQRTSPKILNAVHPCASHEKPPSSSEDCPKHCAWHEKPLGALYPNVRKCHDCHTERVCTLFQTSKGTHLAPPSYTLRKTGLHGCNPAIKPLTWDIRERAIFWPIVWGTLGQPQKLPRKAKRAVPPWVLTIVFVGLSGHGARKSAVQIVTPPMSGTAHATAHMPPPCRRKLPCRGIEECLQGPADQVHVSLPLGLGQGHHPP